MPYQGLPKAFGGWINSIVGDPEKITYWGEKIFKATTPDTKLLLDVLPELSKLVGKQDHLAEDVVSIFTEL